MITVTVTKLVVVANVIRMAAKTKTRAETETTAKTTLNAFIKMTQRATWERSSWTHFPRLVSDAQLVWANYANNSDYSDSC